MTTSALHFPYPVVTARHRTVPSAQRIADCATFLVHPPYHRLDFHPTLDGLERNHLKPGTIAGIRIHPGGEWADLQPAIRQLRQRLPAAPVVLVLAGGSPRDLLLSSRASRGGVRAVILEDEPLLDGLRAALLCRESLAEDVVEWLSLRRLRLTPMVTSLLTEIFRHAPESPDLSTLLSQLGMAESSARFRLHKRLLPTPSRWFQAARALHCVLRVQAEPRASLLRIAHEFGYTDHSALSQLVYRAFRVRPGAVRGTLGWEWLMHRWIGSIPEVARVAHSA